MQSFPVQFDPEKQTGLVFHIAAFFILGTAGLVLLFFALEQQIRADFMLWLIIAVICLLPLPFIAYSGIALYQARYILEPDGLRIRWGLRSEDIPMAEIEWVRPIGDMGLNVPLPMIRLPGVIFGSVDTRDLGEVEYIASSQETLLLIATRYKIYAISPAAQNEFMTKFRHAMEMGSLSPIESFSSRPTLFLQQIWQDSRVRIPIIINTVLTLLVFATAFLAVSQRDELSMGYNAFGIARESGPSEHVFLLPILGSIAYVVDNLLAMFFYRRPEHLQKALMIWYISPFTPLLLIIALLLML